MLVSLRLSQWKGIVLRPGGKLAPLSFGCPDDNAGQKLGPKRASINANTLRPQTVAVQPWVLLLLSSTGQARRAKNHVAVSFAVPLTRLP